MSQHSFRAAFGSDPIAVSVAPGRINLIGEHVDYAGFGVLPCAIDRSVTVSVGPGRGLAATSTAAPGHDLHAGASPVGWQRYVAAAARVLDVVDARVAVDADLPTVGGLSSSSALTVGAIVALARLGGRDLDRDEVVGLAVAAERSLGVAGGAMDQTVIVAGEAGSFLAIDFVPPAWRPVRVPPRLRMVVASSGTPAPKAAEFRDEYNLLAGAARAAALLVGAELGVDPGDPPMLARLGDLLHAGVGLPELVDAVGVASLTGADPAGVAPHLPVDRPLPVGVVYRHITSEAARVTNMEGALSDGDLEEIGRILDASHDSLAGLGVSTPDLDAVTDAMREAGAFGARLTGAGFGGMALAVCSPGDVASVVEAASSVGGGPAFEVSASDGARLVEA